VEHVLLPVLDDARTHGVTKEMLEVERTAIGVRLLHSPAYLDGIAGGDVIELDPSALCGYNVVSRGGNVAIVVIFTSQEQRQQAEPQLAGEALRLQGRCDGGPERVLVFTIPATSGFANIEGVFDAVPQQCPGATWYFGNVYGPDKRPLNWWS
jgi:Domain of unknown function (DUF4265)